VKVFDQLWAPPPRRRRRAESVPESKRPSAELTLWQEPTTVDGTFHVPVLLAWTVPEHDR